MRTSKALARTSGAIARGAEVTLRGWWLRVVLAVVLFAAAAWFVGLAGYFAGVALGFDPAHHLPTVAAVLLTPAVLACAVAPLDGGLALIGRRDGPGRWTRISSKPPRR